MPKPLCKQSKEFIVSLVTYFEREWNNGGPLLPITTVIEVKSYDEQHVTRRSLLSILVERDLFKGNISSLSKVLKNIGFHWKIILDEDMKLQHIAARRAEFLQYYIRNVNSDSPLQFVYLDETWIFENGSVSRSWHDNDRKSVKRTKSDGKRFIIVHAGNKQGFVPEAALIFSSGTNTPDYHGEINQVNFMIWFENQLLANLEESSIIIMDNASYYSGICDKTPNSSWRKADIQNWLHNHNIIFSADLLKTQLCLLSYRIDLLKHM